MGRTKNFSTENYDFNPKSKKAIMLIHGFASTTYEVSHLAKFLEKHGFRVVLDNLPGHGTTIEDCNSIKYQEWISFAEKRFAEISIDCEEIYVIGFSMGAILGLHLASLFPVDKLVIAAPVMSFKSPFKVNVLVRLLNKIVTKQKKGKQQSGLKTITNYSGYDHYPLTALNEFRKLNTFVYKRLARVNCPLLYVHSNSDKVSLSKNIHIILNQINSSQKDKLIVEQARHHLFYKNPDQELIFNTIYNFIH